MKKPTEGWQFRLISLLMVITALIITSPVSFFRILVAAAFLFVAIRELIADTKPRYGFTTMFDEDILSPMELDTNGHPKILFKKGMQVTGQRIETLIEVGIETFPIKIDYGQDNTHPLRNLR